MTFERIFRPSSTTAAAVSSHELSMPRTSTLPPLPTPREFRQTVRIGSASNSDFGHDRGHEFVRRDIECGIENRYPLRNDTGASDMCHFSGRPLFDGDMRAIRNREIQRGERRGYVERNFVLARQHRDRIRSNLVRNVSVRRDAVRTYDYRVDKPLSHECAGHVVGDHAHINVVLPELPCGQARALQERPRFVRENL